MKKLRIGFWGIACLALVAWGAWGVQRAATPVVSATTNGPVNRVIFYPEPGDTVAHLQAMGLSNIEKYGSYWLAEANGPQMQSLKKTIKGRLESASNFNKIELNEASFDVTQGQPAVPEHLKEATNLNRLLRIVQFKGPVLPVWLTQLKAIKGVRVINYIPNNAYLVAVQKDAEAQVRSLVGSGGPVQWVGVFHPAYKVKSTLRKATGTVAVTVIVSDSGNAAEVATAVATIRRYALGPVKQQAPTLHQVVLTLQASATDLSQIAQIPDVLWIEPVQQMEQFEERADLIVSTHTNGAGHGPSPGADYVDFLTNVVGFSTSPSDYPIVDVADTGIDNGTLYPYHPDFYQFSMDVTNFIATWNCTQPPPPGGLFPTRLVYNDLVDTDGHGTLVASVLGGIVTDPPTIETVHMTTLGALKEVNIILSIVPTCVTQSTTIVDCSSTGCTAPNCCTGVSFTVTCSIVTNTVCDGYCAIAVDPLPFPVGIVKTDLGGFRYGLGINPYGRIGASAGGAQAGFAGAVGEAQSAYLRRARISNNSWGEVLSVGGNDGAYDALSQAYDGVVRDAVLTGHGGVPGPSPVNQEFVVVFAGGNANGSSKVGGYGDVLVTPPATAKNVITVGASQNVHPVDGCLPFPAEDSADSFDMAYFSSFGPTRDGRFKPDLVAPGASVYGAWSQTVAAPPTGRGCDPNNPTEPGFPGPPYLICGKDAGVCNIEIPVAVIESLYVCNSGTSFSAPMVSGAAQLLWWYFQNRLVDERGQPEFQPSPAMVKAYMLNSARYLSITNPATGTIDALPSIAQGMGELDLARMFDGAPRVIRDESTPRAIDTPLYSTNSVTQQTYFSATGQSYELSGVVASNGLPFRVTLAWTDAPAELGALKQLVNDLDLEVTVGGTTYAGNDFNTEYAAVNLIPKYDHVNNVESVFLPAGLAAGTPWTIFIRATNIAGDGVPNIGNSTDQDFALVVYNGTSPSDIRPIVTTNNSCQSAANIGAFPFTWTNTLSSTAYAKVHPSPVAGRGGIEEFFKIPQPSPGTTFSVNTFGSSFDTIVSVWYGSCGALVEEVSNNDSSNTFQSAVSFTADGTNDYYIIAEPHNASSTNGTLVLNVQASSSLVTFSPSSVLFANQIAGTTSTPQVVTLQNGLSVPLEVQSVTLQGSNATEFVILSDNCTGAQLPLTNGACAISIAFSPTNAAPKSAQLVVVDNATGSPRIVPLAGNGLAAAPVVCLSANRLTYNNTFAGATDTVQTVTIVNCGTAPLNLTNAAITGLARTDYFISADTCGGVPFTAAVVGPGSNCVFSIDFAPVTNGSRTAVLTFYDDAGNNSQQVLLAGDGCKAISMSPTNLPSPTAGQTYIQSITASGGGAPYTYALTSGGLPGGLSFTAAGTISGNATNIGSFTFQVTATDAYGCTGVQNYTLTVGCAALIVEPFTLPDGLQWAPYTNTISVIGGVAPYTFTVSAGALPSGVTLNSTNGVLAGTPSAAGPASFTVSANDINGCNGYQSYTITINPTVPVLGFAPALLPTFGDVVLGTTSRVQSVTVTNSGTAPLIITSITLTNGDASEFVLDQTSSCIGASVPAGGTCAVNLSFAPLTSGDKGTTVMVWDNSAGNPHSFPIKGAGIAPQMSVLPASINFGTQTVAVASAPQRVIVKNTGDGPMTITSVTAICTNGPDFAVVADNCLNTPMQPGDSCSISVNFKPGATFPRAGTLVIAGTATNSPQLVSLSGVGANTAPSLWYSPTELYFVDTVLGTTGGVQSVTVSNAGTASLVIKSLSFSGGASNNFFIPYSNCLDGTILPGAICNIPVKFVPTTAGPTNSTLQILSNSGNGTNTVLVSGSGVGPFISLSATNLFFGSNTVGVVSPVQSVIVSNTGSGPLVITGLNLSGLNPGDFSIISSNCVGGEVLPGKTCEIDVLFQTAVALPRSAILSIVGNEVNLPAPVTIALSGVGLAYVCPTITVGPASLPNAFSRVNYNQNLSGSGSGGLYNFTLTGGQLPAGVTLSAGGVLSGLPGAVGTNAFTVTATDANGCSGSKSYSLVVTCPTYTILPSTVAQATMGTAYNQPLTVRLPDGSSVSSTLQFDNLTSFGISDAVTQNIGGVVFFFQNASQLTFTSTVTVAGVNAAITNLTASMYMNYNDNSQSPLALRTGIGQLTVKLIGPDKTTVTLTGGHGGAGTEYGVACAPASSRTIFDDSTTNAIADPTNVSPYDGTFHPDVPLNAFVGKTGAAVNGVWTLEVDVAPSFLRADSGTVFCWGLSIASPQITYAVTGSLPPGITLTVGGLLSGTPTASGSYTSIVTVTDASGCTGSQPLIFNVAPTAPIIGFVPNPLTTFGDVVLGSTSIVQSVTVTNLGNGPLVITNLTLVGANTNDFSLTPASPCLNELLPPGGICQINVQFAPTASGNRGASVLVYDNSPGNPHTFAVSGAGIVPLIVAAPTSLDFGTQTVNVASAPQWVEVFNTGNGPLTITGLAMIGTNSADFSVVTNQCLGAAIQPGSSCSIGLNFTPGATLARSATLVITDTATNTPLNIPLRGIGADTAPAISLTPSSLTFGDQLVGTTSAVQQVTGGAPVTQIIIGNPGSAALVIDSISVVGSNAVDFVVTNFGGCVGAAIQPGGNCTVTVAAAPVDSGLLTAAVRIISNAGNGTNDVPVLGSGVAPIMLLSTNALDFGTNTVNGTTPAQTVFIENIGNAVLNITNIVLGGVNPGDFTILTNASSCLSTSVAGTAILPGGECQVSLTFRTTTMLARSATLTISSNATNTPQVVALRGAGTPCRIIVLSPSTVPAVTVGSAYSQTLTAANGTSPYTFQLLSGVLPNGLSLSSTGVLAGATTATGSYPFTVQATDTYGCTGTRSYTLTVTCPAIPILPATNALPAGTAGVNYTQSFIVTNNGAGPYTFSVSGGTLPTGLALAPSGALTGVPTVGGNFSFTVLVQDANGCTSTRNYSIAVSCPTVTLTPTILPNPVAGVPYTQSLTATNGIAPYFFQITGGALPAGLSLGARGQLSGTPNAVGTNFTFTVQAQDANGCLGSQTYTVSVTCPTLNIVPATLLNGNKGLPYNQTFGVNGSSAVFNFAVTGGALPPGLTFSSSGTLFGTPTTFGSYTFTITATASDASGCTVSQSYSMAIVCQSITVGPLTLPGAAVNSPYTQSIQASGGTIPITFAVTSGSLPTGLTMSSAGVITGTPITSGTYQFTVTATDDNGCTGSQPYAISVACVPLVLTPQVLPTPIKGEAYGADIIAVGHTGTVSFANTSGSLPPGLTVTSGGSIAGTPALFGSYTFQVTAYDPVSRCSGQRFYTLSIGCQTLTLAPSPSITLIGSFGVLTNYAFSASGGLAPNTFTQTSGSFPAGMTLNPTTGVLSGIPVSASSAFGLTVTDSNGCSTTASYTLMVLNACAITMLQTNLPGGTVGANYVSGALINVGSGGVAPYTYTVANGASLPSGLTLSDNGLLSGVPVTNGVFNFTAIGMDANGCWATQNYSLTINCSPITVAPASASLTPGTNGVAYSQSIIAANGIAPYTFTAGNLPSGISLDHSSGILSGTPTAGGTTSFTVTVTDAAGCSTNVTYSLFINQAVADLAVSYQTPVPNPVTVGSNLTYTIVIVNYGPSVATNVTMTDVLPASLTFVSTSSGFATNGSTVTCSLGTLASGDSTNVTITATAGLPGSLTNTVSVFSSTFDSNPSNNTYTIVSTASNIVQTSAARQVVNASAGQAVVTVIRQGDLSVPASVQYATSDDTALVGIDYVATAGTVTFNPGDKERSVLVPLLSKAGSKAGKSVKLVLRNPIGATLGRATSVVTILSSTTKAMSFTNAAGDVVTAQLTGPGAMQVALVSNAGPIDQILLTNTTTASSLSIAVKRGQQSTGIVTVGSIVGGPLKSINAAAVNLAGAGINLSGGLGSLLVNAVNNSAVLVQGNLGTVSVTALANALVAAGYTPASWAAPFAGGTFTAGLQIKSVAAKNLANSVIAAAKIGTVQLGTVTTANNGVAFGVLAQTKPGAVAVTKPKFNWKAKGALDQALGDFHVQY